MRKRRDARSPASTTIAGTTSELCSVDVVTAVAVSITAGRRASAMTFFLRHSQQPFEEAVGIKTRLSRLCPPSSRFIRHHYLSLTVEIEQAPSKQRHNDEVLRLSPKAALTRERNRGFESCFLQRRV
jgi:hypothetical protein